MRPGLTVSSVLVGCIFGAFFAGTVARFIGGIGVGAASMLSPMYIAEIAPAQIRGQLVSLNQLTIIGGMLIAYFVDFLLADVPDTNWRWMFGSETLDGVRFCDFLQMRLRAIGEDDE